MSENLWFSRFQEYLMENWREMEKEPLEVFSEILHISQENTYARVPFLIKLQAYKACNFNKKRDYSTGVFLVLCEIFKNTIFKEHLRGTFIKTHFEAL